MVTIVPLNGLNYPTWKLQCKMTLNRDGRKRPRCLGKSIVVMFIFLLFTKQKILYIHQTFQQLVQLSSSVAI